MQNDECRMQNEKRDRLREQVRRLAALGPLPLEANAAVPAIRDYQDLLKSLGGRVNDEEAAALCRILPATEESCFGLAWTVLHLVESAPGWPLPHCLKDPHGPDL
jgi:hypothetical protein